MVATSIILLHFLFYEIQFPEIPALLVDMRQILNEKNPTKYVCEIESEGESAPIKSSKVSIF